MTTMEMHNKNTKSIAKKFMAGLVPLLWIGTSSAMEHDEPRSGASYVESCRNKSDKLWQEVLDKPEYRLLSWACKSDKIAFYHPEQLNTMRLLPPELSSLTNLSCLIFEFLRMDKAIKNAMHKVVEEDAWNLLDLLTKLNNALYGTRTVKAEWSMLDAISAWLVGPPDNLPDLIRLYHIFIFNSEPIADEPAPNIQQQQRPTVDPVEDALRTNGLAMQRDLEEQKVHLRNQDPELYRHVARDMLLEYKYNSPLSRLNPAIGPIRRLKNEAVSAILARMDNLRALTYLIHEYTKGMNNDAYESLAKELGDNTTAEELNPYKLGGISPHGYFWYKQCQDGYDGTLLDLVRDLYTPSSGYGMDRLLTILKLDSSEVSLTKDEVNAAVVYAKPLLAARLCEFWWTNQGKSLGHTSHSSTHLTKGAIDE